MGANKAQKGRGCDQRGCQQVRQGPGPPGPRGARVMDFRPHSVNKVLHFCPVPSFMSSSSPRSLCFRRKGRSSREKEEIVGNFKERASQACVLRGRKVSEEGG